MLLAALLSLLACAPAFAAECPNEQLRAENHSLALPDCRAYERVSPASTNGAPIGSELISADGSAVGFQSLGLFGEPGATESTDGPLYTSTRDASGWTTTANEASAVQFQDETPQATAEGRAYSANLGENLYTLVPSSASPIDFRFYRRRRSDGTMVEVGPAVPPNKLESWTPAEGQAPIVLLGASNDLAHVFFAFDEHNARDHWEWPGDPTPSEYSLYEYTGTGNAEPKLVDVKPGPGEANARPSEHPNVTSGCGAELGYADLFYTRGHTWDSYNAISTPSASDASPTVYFTALSVGPRCREPGVTAPLADELYARLDGTHTVAISEPSKEDCEACDTSEAAQEAAPRGGIFQGASQDGSRVFFLSEQRLFDGAKGETGENLYEYDFAAANPHERVSLIAPIAALGESASSEGVMRVSNDGSHVYFVSKDVLAGTKANEFGTSPEEHADNLYVYDTDARTVTFITILSPNDSREWGVEDSRGSVETTPDGRFLLFSSVNDVTPDASGEASQLYRYDARPASAEESGIPRLVRISVGDATSNDGNDGFESITGGQAYELPVPAFHKADFMADDGSRVFFQSRGRLAPGALDNACAYVEGGVCVSPAYNTYEFENGRVYLLSDGRDTHSNFRGTVASLIGASPSGSDVYIKSADPLTGEPGGEAATSHIFDARVDGGFPVPPALTRCTDECQGPGSSPPTFSSPGSSTFVGPGNPSSQPGARKVTKTAAQVKAAQLASALRQCRAKRNRHSRVKCEAQARRRYGPQARKASHRRKLVNR